MSNQIELNIDASSLSKSACMFAWTNVIIGGYCDKVCSADIVYGQAIHRFIETMFKTGGDLGAGFEAAKDTFNVPKIHKPKKLHMSDEKHMLTSCYNLWEGYIQPEKKFEVLVLNGKAAVEQTFRIPFYEDTNIRVFLCGTIDRIGKFKSGIFAIGDWKTTSSWETDTYLSKYEMAAQLRFYTLACKLINRIAPDSTLGKIGASNMGCFIDGVFIKAKANDNEYLRSEVFQFKPSDIESFEAMLLARIKDLSNAVASGVYDKQGKLNGACESKWGKCNFWNVCRSGDSSIEKIMLSNQFKQRAYDPLNFHEK